jgi:phosphoglycerate kinase
MAHTFLFARGDYVGTSKVQTSYEKKGKKIDLLDYARHVMKEAGDRVVLPTDAIWTDSLEDPNESEEHPFETAVKDKIAVDIGTKTTAEIIKIIASGKTIFWNGPLGAFDFNDAFAFGTNKITHEIILRTAEGNVTSVIGGGDTTIAIRKAGVPKGMDVVVLYELIRSKILNILTGGGATLQAVAEGINSLPGVMAVIEPGILSSQQDSI